MNRDFLFNDSAKIFDLAEDNEMAYYSEVDEKDFLNYLEKISKNTSLSLFLENKIGNHLFYKYKIADGGLLSISYIPGDSSLRIVYDPMKGNCNSYAPIKQEKFEQICPVTFSMLSLDYTNQKPTDAAGLGASLLLKDGSFIIWDGGLTCDSVRLYDYLYDRTPLKNHQIVISAWIFTHSHGDHYGNFHDFAARYSDCVTLKYVMANNPIYKEEYLSETYRDFDNYINSMLYEDAKKFGDVKFVLLHTGDKIEFAGATVNVLHTYEDILPSKMQWLNECSVVTMVYAEGQKILMMGDGEILTNPRLLLYGNELKCDILQCAHHGYSGGSQELFDLMDPSFIFWPTNFECYCFRTLPSWREGLYYNLLARPNLKRSFVCDGLGKVLKLPIKEASEVEYYKYPIHKANG